MPSFADMQEIDAAGQKIKVHTGLFINNEFIASKSGKSFPTINPGTGDLICDVQEADAADVDAAVAAAKAALPGWLKVSGAERGKMIWKLAELIEKNAEYLATVECLDNGLKRSLALRFVQTSANRLRYFAGFADKIHGKVMMDEPGYMNFTRHEPYGIAGAIIPWNAPLATLGSKLGAGFAAGNCIIVKTSEKTPLSGLALAALAVEAGFPPGVLSVLSGYGPTAGQAIILHKDILKVSFTGSGRTGRKLLEGCAASNLKKVSLELGGKSPSIVFDDCDLDKAVFWTQSGIFNHNGQICVASSRIYVQETIAEKFLAKFKEMTEKEKPGSQWDDSTKHGPVVDELQYKNILSYIEVGKKEATLVTGGNTAGSKGYYIEPTVFANVKEDSKIMREEVFGPVVCINTFKTEEEAIARANNTSYGLGGAVFTQDLNKAIRVSSALEAGTIWVNAYQVLQPCTPFGGYKESGQGRELGPYGIDDWVQVKSVKINLA